MIDELGREALVATEAYLGRDDWRAFIELAAAAGALVRVEWR